MDKRLSIYVSSPDSYSDVLAVFLKGYRRYWSDCPYEFILTTNTKSYEGITCICNNKQNDTWVERTIAALPVIKSKYVMLMCDDIILSDNVDNSLIERLLDYMDSHEIRYCNLGPTPKGSKIKSFPLLRSVNKQIPYAINYKDVVAVSEYILPYIHGVYKGKWIRHAVENLSRLSLYIDSGRGIVPLSQQIKIDMTNWLQWKISPKQRRALKNVLSRVGMKFATKR